MPNWCMNKLDVIGRDVDLEEFKKATSDSDGNLSFAALVPPPENEPYDWRTWADTHWGTKWDVSPEDCAHDVHHEDFLPTMMWEFTTAWAPPIAWLYQVAAQYPHLDFKLWFDEPGMSFSGCAVLRKGSVDEAESWESQTCFVMGPCAVAGCEEMVDVDAFARHEKPRSDNEHYYCHEHELFEMVEKAVQQENVGL